MNLSRKQSKLIIISCIALIFAIFIFAATVVKTKEGTVSVVYSPNGGSTKVLNPGWDFINLWDSYNTYPTKIVISQAQISVTTNDGKKITMPVRYEVKTDKSKVLGIFKELGAQDMEQLESGYLYQKLYAASREVVSKYSVLEVFSQGHVISTEVSDKMSKSASELGFIISNVTLGTPEVDEKTQAAIDARVQAAQELEKLSLEKQIAAETAARNLIEAKGKADKKVVAAEGNAKAAIAEAEGEAKANAIISNSITQEIIDLNISKARLTHGWVTVQGVGSAIVDSTK